jgi:hypothetical protein
MRAVLPFAVLIAVTPLLPGCRTGTAAVRHPAVGLADLPRIPDGVVSRSISWENRTGEPGRGGMAGGGRKGSPAIDVIRSGETVTLMDVEGPGVIRHMWFTIMERDPTMLRNLILRMYWDDSPVPSVEVPFGDFFGISHGRMVELETAFTALPLGRGFNAYYPMPFHRRARITVQNDLPDGREVRPFFFQIDYELHERLPADVGLFHAQFRRQNPTVEQQDYVVLDGVQGPGLFLGCVIGVRALGPWWWGEGEMKFYMDGDTDYPTVCGTGTEDYFGSGWGIATFQTDQLGCTLSEVPDWYPYSLVSMYRYHVQDPVIFREDFKATIQQIGWRPEGKFERSDDWASVAFWYQREPVTSQPPFPDRELRTVGIVPPAEGESQGQE